jgi:hypothetical protein
LLVKEADGVRSSGCFLTVAPRDLPQRSAACKNTEGRVATTDFRASRWISERGGRRGRLRAAKQLDRSKGPPPPPPTRTLTELKTYLNDLFNRLRSRLFPAGESKTNRGPDSAPRLLYIILVMNIR